MCKLVSSDGEALLQAFFGDDTWMQLFPTQFQRAIPFSSFNVMDLHTVDDGVWQVSTIVYSEHRCIMCTEQTQHATSSLKGRLHTASVPSCTYSTRTCAPLSPTVSACRYFTAGGPCSTCKDTAGTLEPAEACYAMLQNLIPTIREPAEWDVVIGHYLGVDHVGHTYDVHSPHMAAKLQQMNQRVEQVRCHDHTMSLHCHTLCHSI